MAHKHSMYDADPHYVIDSITRKITTESRKVKLMQCDHKSERFTFELPRFAVDGHDMSLCNRVVVHYNNTSTNKAEINADAYEVDDLKLAPDDENVVIFSWLVSQNATQLAGMLSFSVCFSCVADDGALDYSWHTDIYTGITIAESIHNDAVIVDRHSDVLSQLEARIDTLEQGGASDEQIAQAVNNYLQENPVQAGATTEQAAQIEQNKEDIEKLATDKVDNDQLLNAVNDALEQAKTSGDFKGDPGDDYILTDADKTEIAEQAAKMVEVEIPEGEGAAGENGGYYTPKVEQTDANTMRVSYTASKSGMVTVADQNITLPAGPKGDTGAKGDKGDTGAQGEQGPAGAAGAKGDKGDKGDTGAMGATGPQGPKGDKGLDATPVTPLFAQNKEWLDANGDTAKFYVLPDGFLYAYLYKDGTGPLYTNLAGAVQENTRLNSSGVAKSGVTGAITTGFIPVKQGEVVRVRGFDPTALVGSNYPYIAFYTSASESAIVASDKIARGDGCWTLNGDVYEWTAFTMQTNAQHSLASTITHVRINGAMTGTGADVIVTVNEEIVEGTASGYFWENTGHAFVPADYEDRIIALEDEVERLKASGTGVTTSGNILDGKKWVACGDSLTANGYTPDDGFDESVYIYQEGRFKGSYKVYPFMIGLRNNMNIVNLATGGQTMAASNNSFMTRYMNIDADADYITIMLGANDEGTVGIPVGNLDDNTDATFCGAYNIAMEHILENHPFAHIGIVVENHTNAEYMEATRKMAERWGVPCLDLGSPQVPLMNRYTGRNVCAKAQEIREKNFSIRLDENGSVVNAHPNTAAQEYFSTFFEAWLRTL